MGGIYTVPVEFPARKCTIVTFSNPLILWICNNSIKIVVLSVDLNCVLLLLLDIDIRRSYCTETMHSCHYGWLIIYRIYLHEACYEIFQTHQQMNKAGQSHRSRAGAA